MGKKIVWIISEGSPGHISQSKGLVNSLAAIVPLQMITIEGRATVRGWIRPLIRFFMGKKGRPLPSILLKHISNMNIPKKVPAPDLIVSSGGKSVFVAKTVSQQYQVPYVFIGERKPYPAEWFHTIISPVPGESCQNSIDVELIPTPVTPDFIAQKGITEKDLWCMIIGGSSRSRRFSEEDWTGLANGMNILARKYNIRWLLTTSRRTGRAIENLLKQTIDPKVLVDAIWWADKPRRELYTFMARGEVLFVTQDSLTMITEAVGSGKPVVALQPKEINADPDNFSVVYLERLDRNERIVQQQCCDFKEFSLDDKNFSPIKTEKLEFSIKNLLENLKFNK